MVELKPVNFADHGNYLTKWIIGLDTGYFRENINISILA